MNLSGRARAALGSEVLQRRPLSGGDLSEVSLLTLADGQRVVAKRAPGAEREARMLAAIRATGCPAPEVLHSEAGLVVMSLLDGDGDGTADGTGWAEAGAAVARMHAVTETRYGWEEDHAFGRAPIPRGGGTDWPAFWAEHRILAWPEDLPTDLARRVEQLASRLPGLIPSAPPPALLHGDLWAGNLLFGRHGFSGLIDPACAHGDAEVDLAMLTLFGAPAPAFFEAYGPLAPGWKARRPVYQLWPALVHLRLFGAGYRPLVERLLAASGI